VAACLKNLTSYRSVVGNRSLSTADVDRYAILEEIVPEFCPHCLIKFLFSMSNYR
jgi:hypothetical protein